MSISKQRKTASKDSQPLTRGILKEELKNYVTREVLREELKNYVTRAHFDEKMAAIDRRFEVMEDNFARLYSHVDAMKKGMDDQFNRMFNRMDAFLKKSEDNELEIKLLGRQHDDLAKYCTENIGYPTYGRNLD